MSKFFYLDVSLNFDNSAEADEVDAISFKNFINSTIRTLFGDFELSFDVDLLKYDEEKRRGIIRCPAQEYVKIRSALAFCGKQIVGPSFIADQRGKKTAMSLCKKEGKDVIIFASKEDHDIPSKVTLPELEPQPGLIFPNGEINWNCPCLGGMATGPCGVEFREAFSCFHYSDADPKGSDCVELFKEMHNCMQEYPALYDNSDGKEDDNEDIMGMNVEDSNQSSTDQQLGKPREEVSSPKTN